MNKIIISTFFVLAAIRLSISATSPEVKTCTATPIKHLVVIFQENRTFDHYFGTYPHAENNPGEVRFIPKKNTPSINGLSLSLMQQNQNLAQPFRFAPSQVNTSNPIHLYTVLQQACDKGLMDMFVQTTGADCIPPATVMGHFDGNTVTALWNYAQHFAMSDNFRTTNIGKSTPGHVNLISGNSHGAIPSSIPNFVVDGTIIDSVEPIFDHCSTPPLAELTGLNVGNLLNNKGVTWGWFHGGFADCSASHPGPDGQPVVDYVAHHNPFQYYQSTSNPQHLPPSSPAMVGKTDQANHNYDISDFWAAAQVGNVPSVSFFKAPSYQDGEAGNSSPLFEQQFLVSIINRLQKLPQWKHMAIIITWDDSGGWYDHEMPVIINQSQTSYDALVGPGNAGNNPPLGGYQARPGYGFRVPFILISPWAKTNYVDHNLIDQTSILRFIEDNWDVGQIGDFSFDAFAGSLLDMFDFTKRKKGVLILNPDTGKIIRQKRK